MSESTKAAQIIDLNEKNEVILNESALHDILMKDNIKETQVCVISVTGEFRQGKFFLLNFFIKYLRMKETILLTDNQDEWLNLCEHQPLEGFPWKGGRERHTTGILLWPEIFISTLPSGEEIAIILLDTQGSFDNQTTTTQSASIFALSSLISSVQIYNLKEDIKQTDLSHLACFSNYGQIVSKCKESPFQKLVFLVRDWRWNEQKEYGSGGGQERLNEIMNSSEDSYDELKLQWEKINSLFKEKSCFLMPHPGFLVANKVDGRIEDIVPDFKKHVQKFVADILAPENLVPKTDLNGHHITVGALFNYIKTYCEHFQNSDIPSPESMYMATCGAYYRTIMEKSEVIYDDLMKDILDEKSEPLGAQLFITRHHESVTKAIEYFSEANMMGDINLQKKYKMILEENLHKRISTFMAFNKLKQNNKDKNRVEINPLITYLYKYCGKTIHAYLKSCIAIKKDIKNMSFRNTAEALPKLGGSLGGGALTAAASIATVEFLAATTLGPVGAIAIGLTSYLYGSYGGYRIVSSATKSLYNFLGFGIITRKCVHCNQEFKCRKYKGENYTACSTCAEELYKK